MNIYRAQINQPSTHQPLHKLNSTYCIVVDNGGPVVDIYFTEGAVHSMRVLRLCISRVKLSSAEDRAPLPKETASC